LSAASDRPHVRLVDRHSIDWPRAVKCGRCGREMAAGREPAEMTSACFACINDDLAKHLEATVAEWRLQQERVRARTRWRWQTAEVVAWLVVALAVAIGVGAGLWKLVAWTAGL